MKQLIKTLKIITKGQGLYEFTSDIVKHINKIKNKKWLVNSLCKTYKLFFINTRKC